MLIDDWGIVVTYLYNHYKPNADQVLI